MNREDIIKLAQEAGLIRAGEHYTEPARWGITEITDFYQRAVAAERQRIITKNALEIERINAYIKELEEALVIGREKVAAWMMRQGYATGHGDTVEDLLKELEWQIREREREACAKVQEFVCSTGLCRLTLTQTNVGIKEPWGYRGATVAHDTEAKLKEKNT
jgi:hypothetical protein